MALGKRNDRFKLQTEIRAQPIDPSDSSSPYRALRVLDGLQTQPDDNIRTLADIPDYCRRRYANKETLGTREILDVHDEEQSN